MKLSMSAGNDFLLDFGVFLVEKWMQVGSKIEEKSMLTSKGDFLKKHCFFRGKKNYFL